MNTLIKKAIFVMAIMISASMALGQQTKLEPEFDYVNISFQNMGDLTNLPGTVTVKWQHNATLWDPIRWNIRSFPYAGSGEYSDYPNWNPRNYLDIIVIVSLGSPYTSVSATKHWDGVSLNFVFTAIDFASGPGPGPGTSTE